MEDARAIADAMAEHEPVFIAGVPRSGTSALRRTLARLDAFAAREPKAPETGVFVRPKRVKRILKPGGRDLFRYLLGDEAAARRLLRLVDGLPRAADPDTRDAWRIRLFFHVALAARGSQRVLEKTPNHVHHLDRVFRAFPRARVLVCVRHPVDVYASYRKRLARLVATGRRLPHHDWLAATPAEFASSFARVAEHMRETLAAHADRAAAVRVVRYEDLTGGPERELAAICAFVGEPFDRAALVGVEEVRDEQGAPRLRGRLVENKKRWQDFVTADEARDIGERAAAAMASFGYAKAPAAAGDRSRAT